MLDLQFLVERDRFRDVVGVEFKQLHVKERAEVTAHVLARLETGPQPVGHGCHVRHEVLLGELGGISDCVLDFAVIRKQPGEDRILDLLVVLLFKELVIEEANGAEHEELAARWLVVVASSDGPVQRVANSS